MDVTRYLAPVAFVLASGSVAAAPTTQTPMADLQETAREQGLAGEREWQDLLHYRERRFLPGRRSESRDSGFFNADDGWRDPEAELDATIAAFFRDPDTVDGDEQHPQCRFPARRAWLKERLELDPDVFPAVACQRFEEWYEGIDPHEITLVFAAAYLGNPASMYGHTLLRVDPPDQDEDTRLLSYVINHAAATEESSGLVFAVRGLTGGYPGLFSIMPYYDKVREYNSLESRDLWEYRLNLEPHEVERLMQHTWELRDTPFPYYFLYQNCSYRLLELLDVARPGMNLSDRFNWWAIPTDTVREVLREEDMLREVVYRPAERTRLDHQIAIMPPELLDVTVALARGERSPDAVDDIEREQRGLVLETAYDYLNFLRHSGDMEGDQRERMRELLIARSQLSGVPGAERPPKPDTRPDQGHRTLRLGAGGGERGDATFGSLHWRPAYHDMLDPPEGYIPGAHISYGDVEVRYDEGRDRIELERLMVIDIESLNPRDQLFRPWSWNIRAGAEQRLRPDGRRSLMGGVDGGGGFTWQAGDTPLWAYAGVQADAWGSERLDDSVRAGAGPRLDLLWTGASLRTRLRAETAWQTDTSRPAWRVSAEQSFTAFRNVSLRVGVTREHDFDVHENAVQATLYGYF
ncbi:DUF4105 domain-containing protein [Aquisalimonas asiatica]|uniref:Uncharacterized protein n=1 Tax=Aquisalimonas asiatica TaxID=406100 RepID=A0A1H8PR22_9GAMM|nr:DUF4105 domain-containing protein [Aquisalimonas asiatica]SEO44452.1 protein of unknown function [Aquisalimonas asiatica]